MAPASRIRGTNNLLVMSGALMGKKAVVHYTLDPLGLVHDVWILTDAERKKQPWPTKADRCQGVVVRPDRAGLDQALI